ncbi:DUF4271 domain-containing protein [Snuella sedimenti]|uniref:DUF4271 domain-containing protein n=1 Tax=Snuella sedimenti TaxID=2798802 RepID=A0A8J7IXK3_9FLAO|nr:DUF4271 domain-containing protein [Snuella sedimenti]MBJ6369115.1 DUF4271 domain-containing protein [Snuella sedimenti]
MLRDTTSNELFTILIVTGLIFVTLAKLIASKRFNDLISIAGNFKYLKIYGREQKFLDTFDALLFVNLILSVSVFGSIIYQNTMETKILSINIIIKLIIGIGSLILIKVLIERLIASLFDIDKIIDAYLFQKISYKNFMGLLLIPMNALLLYSIPPSLTNIYIMVIILLIINLLGVMTSFKSYQSLIKHNFFYFILYLCALEIAPYIILYKVFIA